MAAPLTLNAMPSRLSSCSAVKLAPPSRGMTLLSCGAAALRLSMYATVVSAFSAVGGMACPAAAAQHSTGGLAKTPARTLVHMGENRYLNTTQKGTHQRHCNTKNMGGSFASLLALRLRDIRAGVRY